MKKIRREEQTKMTTVTDTFCDKCSKEVVFDNYIEVDVSMKDGSYDFWEGTFFGDEYSVDLCKECALNLFKNILPSHGININIE